MWIPYKGHYKYDKVKWRQDFRGWTAQMSKDWIDEDEFDAMPMEVFRQYDELRMDLADEVLQVVEDSLVVTHMDSLVKRVQPDDLGLIRLIRERGPIHSKVVDTLNMKRALIRCKARGLVVPVRVKGKYYKYDITDLSLELLQRKKQPTEKAKQYQV